MSNARKPSMTGEGASGSDTIWVLRPGATATIGRDATCDVMVSDLEVSKVHARIDVSASDIRVHDAGSSNGTFIDDKLVVASPWPNDAIVRLGHTRFALSSNMADLLATKQFIAARPPYSLEWRTKSGSGAPAGSKTLRPGIALTIGRSSSSDIVLDDPTVSRSHARVEMLTDSLKVTKLRQGGANLLDGRDVVEAELLLGQTLTIGAYQFKLRARIGHGTAANGSTPMKDDSREETARARRAGFKEPPELRILWQNTRGDSESKWQWKSLPKGKSIIVGKAPECEIRLDDPLVSSKHARLDISANGVQVTDLDSTNGTKLGGRPIDKESWRTDQILEIGGHQLRIQALSQSRSYDKDATSAFLGQPAVGWDAGSVSSRLRVFISYSRRDKDIADALTDALEKNGFDVTIDRRDLQYGEKWQQELKEFIRIADTMVFLVSPSSIASEWCNWELERVRAGRKRLFPVVVQPTPIDELPGDIRRIHLFPSAGVLDIARDLPHLVKALNTDHDWIKQHTRLYDRALEWRARGRSRALLLRGVALTQAATLIKRKPPAHAIAEEVVDYIRVSRYGQFSRFMSDGTQWGVVAGSIIVAVSMAYIVRTTITYIPAPPPPPDPGVDRIQIEWVEVRTKFYRQLSEALGGRADIQIRDDRFILQSGVLFASGQAQLTAEGRAAMEKLATTAKELERIIPSSLNWVLQVDGYTDKRPIANSIFPSNWELSTARANSVVRFLIERGMSPRRLAAAGHGEQNPLDPRDTEEGYRINRRIELKLTNR